MTTIVGHNSPDVSALCRFSPRVQHRRAGLVDEDAIRTAQMDLHVVDHRHQVETGAADPVAKRAAIQVDPLPLEDLGLAAKRKMVAELRNDDPDNEQFRGQPAGHDMLRGVRLCHGLRAAAASIVGTPRDQQTELGRDHVEPLGDVFADLRHFAAAAGAEGAGGLNHPLDPRQMSAVARRLARRLSPGPLQCRLGLLLRGLDHALGQFRILERQVELVGRQLLGLLPNASRCDARKMPSRRGLAACTSARTASTSARRAFRWAFSRVRASASTRESESRDPRQGE